jgi:hypothetical protein
MRPDRHPLSPAERRHAVAAVLAAGLLRFAERPPSPPVLVVENLANSCGDCLELPPETRLSVHNG